MLAQHPVKEFSTKPIYTGVCAFFFPPEPYTRILSNTPCDDA
jgi:hypothetical protein